MPETANVYAADAIEKEVGPPPNRNRVKLIVASVVGAIVIIAVVLLAYFLTRNKSSSSSVTGTSSPASKANATSTAGSNSTNSTTSTTPVKKGKLFGYYGQNAIANGVDIMLGTNSRNTSTSDYQRPLAYYCQTEGFKPKSNFQFGDLGFYDTVNLAFLNVFGGGQDTFTITFASFNLTTPYGGHYTYNGDGVESNDAGVVEGYANIGADIKTCQALGVKIVLSLGGDRVSPYTFVAGDGLAYATLFYNMFLDGTSSVRPFGAGVILDGIEMDVEKNDDPAVWNPEMIALLTNLKKLSPKSQVAVVPQCFLGTTGQDQNVGDVIASAASSIDYLIIQYYNNPVCSYPYGFNYKTWTSLYSGPLVIGLAGDWTSAISGGFLDDNSLQTVYDLVKDDSQFTGFSVYDVSSSNPPAFAWSFLEYSNPPISHYSQTLRDVLDGQTIGVSSVALGTGPLGNTSIAMRCGGTWVEANSTCSNAVCSDTSSANCGTNQNCFQNLSPVC
ncbi:Chitinase 1 [Physocladia obscura]|uniref:Chitinase 1 n=1 Tax=Physocladia obscura TaxID=109957 RepID=A0AAD5SQV1_9FUNG|nr:Chitinase 1 [Physocladia obscura]